MESFVNGYVYPFDHVIVDDNVDFWGNSVDGVLVPSILKLWVCLLLSFFWHMFGFIALNVWCVSLDTL